MELATTMSIDRSAMVYLIDELEAQTLAERVRSPQDRRAFLIHLTPSGRRAQRKAATALADTPLFSIGCQCGRRMPRSAGRGDDPVLVDLAVDRRPGHAQ
jgi:MarR family